MLTPKDLIQAGIKSGKWIPEIQKKVNEALTKGISLEEALKIGLSLVPTQISVLKTPVNYYINLDTESEAEEANLLSVANTMDAVMKTPVVKAGAIMPDSCPAGPVGTIPVGGVVASKEIHPGMHSADICCSMFLSVVPNKI